MVDKHRQGETVPPCPRAVSYPLDYRRNYLQRVRNYENVPTEFQRFQPNERIFLLHRKRQ